MVSTDNNINPNTMDSSSNPRNTDKDNSMVDSSLRSNRTCSVGPHQPLMAPVPKVINNPQGLSVIWA